MLKKTRRFILTFCHLIRAESSAKLFASLVPMEQIVHVRDGGHIFRVDNTI